MANASHVLANDCCIQVYDKTGEELIGYAYAEELPGGQKQRWLLKAVPGEYVLKPWKQPYTTTEWNALVGQEWTSNSFYVVARSTVTHWREGMDRSLLAQIEPVYPFPLDIGVTMAGGTPGWRPQIAISPVAGNRISAKSDKSPSPFVPYNDLPITAPTRPPKQIIIGDAQLLQLDDYMGYIFGDTDIGKVAQMTPTWQSGEYFLLKSDYASAGDGQVQTQITKPEGGEKHDTLAEFQASMQGKFGAEYPTYIVIGCNYYHGESPPSGVFLLA